MRTTKYMDSDPFVVEQNPVERLAGEVEVVNKRLRQLDVLERDMSELRKFVTHNRPSKALAGDLGKAGAEDFCVGMGDVVRAAIARSKGNPGPWGALHKVADDMTIDEDSRGGYVVPTQYWPGLDHLLSAYGSVWGRCRRLDVPAGRTLKIPTEAVAPTAAWRVAQATGVTEADLQIGQAELEPALVGGFLDVADELLAVPELNFGEIATASIVRAVSDALELALLQGDASGGAGDPPSDGLLVAAGTESQTVLATVTEPLVLNFITEAIADYAAADQGGVLVTTPGVRYTLAGARLGRAVSLLADDLRSYAGLPLLTTPGAFETTHHVLLFNPQDVWTAWTGWRIDVSNGLRFKDYASTLRVLTHADWALPLPGRISKATVTSLI